VVLLAVQIAVRIMVPERFLGNSSLFEDDWFYYIGIARNLADGNGPTFDGVVSTTGFHPLWTWLLAPIDLADPVLPGSTVQAVVLLNAAIILVCAGLTLRLLDVVTRSRASAPLITVASYSVAMPFLLNGMESAAVLLLIVLWGTLALRVNWSRPFAAPWMVAGLGLCTALLPLGRLDAAAIAVLMIGGCALLLDRRVAVVLGASLAVILVVQAGINRTVGGGVVPISGEVKGWWHSIGVYRRDGWAGAADFMGTGVRAARRAATGVGEVPEVGADILDRWAVPALLVVVIMVLIGALRRRGAGSWPPDRRVLVLLWVASAGYVVAQAFYYSFFSASWGTWYQSVAVVLTVVSIGLALDRLTRRVHGALLVLALAAAVVYATTLVTAVQSRRSAVDGPNWGTAARTVVKLLEEHSSPDDRVGVWAAGQIGYYAPNEVVNLEGLVGDAELLRANQDGELLAFVDAAGIRYVVNWLPDRAFDPETRCMRLVGSPAQDLRLRLFADDCRRFELVERVPIGEVRQGFSIYLFRVLDPPDAKGRVSN
jgi:hypothetical protein